MNEREDLKKQLAQAQAGIADLKLRLSNSTMLLKIEMTASGKLPRFDEDLRIRRAGKDGGGNGEA